MNYKKSFYIVLILLSIFFLASRQAIFTTQENLSHSRGTEWQERAGGTSAGATATHAATSDAQHKIFWATFWSDSVTDVIILDGADTLWQVGLHDTTMEFIHVTFPIPLVGTVGNAVIAQVTSSDTSCSVSFGGFSDRIN